MNTFCVSLTEALAERFNIDAVIFVSKKKKHVHLSLKKPLIEFHNFEKIIRFIKNFCEKRRMFLKPYVLNFPKLNQSIKWRYDDILVIKKKELWTIYLTGFMKI